MVKFFFWSVLLTNEAVENFKETVTGIKFIANDRAVTVDDGFPTATKLAQKRAVDIVTQTDAPIQLEYISTGPPSFSGSLQNIISPSVHNPHSLNYRYIYTESAVGENVNGYVIDVYAPDFSSDPEFSTNRVLKRSLQALQPAGFEWDGISDLGSPGHPATMISLAAGFYCGVAKKANIIWAQ